MWKLTIVLTLAVLGFAQEDAETPQNKENENETKLNLSNQGLTSLNKFDFSKYPNLEELDLSNNDLEHIKEKLFTENKHLKKLNMSGNKHLVLPEYSTFLDASIEELDLSNCNIEKLQANIFDGLLNLRVLDLSSNPLEEHAIQLFTVTNLEHLEKIILPHIDESMIREICNEPVHITIGIKSEGYSDSIPCDDVRQGNWQNIAKEIPNHEPEDHPNEESHPDGKDITKAEALTDEANNEVKRQADPHDASADQPVSEASSDGTHEEINHEPEIPPPEIANNAESASETQDEVKTEPSASEDNVTAEQSLSENQDHADPEPSPSGNQDEAEPELSPPEVEVSNSETNPNPEHANEDTENKEDAIPDAVSAMPEENTDTEAPTAAETPKGDEIALSEVQTVVAHQAGGEEVNPSSDTTVALPDVIDGKHTIHAVDGKDISANENQQVSPNNEAGGKDTPNAIDDKDASAKQNQQESNKGEDKQKVSEGQSAVPKQRALPLPPNSNKVESRAAFPDQKSEKMQEGKADTEVKADESTASSGGTNVLVFLVIAVIVAGVAAFGYKFYKSRKYQATHTAEPVERELKEIVVDKRTNGSGNPKDIIEEEPLMEDRTSSVEIKEIDESNKQPEVPKNEAPKPAVNNSTANSSSSPYVSTTTPIKPPSVNKDDKTQI